MVVLWLTAQQVKMLVSFVMIYLGHWIVDACDYLHFWLSCGYQQTALAPLYRAYRLSVRPAQTLPPPGFRQDCCDWGGERGNLSEWLPRRSDWGWSCFGLALCHGSPHCYSNLMETTSHQVCEHLRKRRSARKFRLKNYHKSFWEDGEGE